MLKEKSRIYLLLLLLLLSSYEKKSRKYLMAFRTASYRIDHVGWPECIRRVFCFRSLADFKACYQPKAAECNNDVIFSMTFGTVEKTIDYLCVEGFNGNLVNKQLYMYRLLRA